MGWRRAQDKVESGPSEKGKKAWEPGMKVQWRGQGRAAHRAKAVTRWWGASFSVCYGATNVEDGSSP